VAEPLGLGQERLAAPQLALGVPALGALARFAQRAAHRRDDPREALLEDVVGRADLERLDRHFLAQRSGDEDERHLRKLLDGEVQGGKAVEVGQREVGEDQVDCATLEAGDELVPGLDPRDVARDASVFQHAVDDLGVRAVVLEMQDPQGRAHFFPMLPGGGSLITAQHRL
jgi:hypothetical protein